jgi:hypothetical protein
MLFQQKWYGGIISFKEKYSSESDGLNNINFSIIKSQEQKVAENFPKIISTTYLNYGC